MSSENALAEMLVTIAIQSWWVWLILILVLLSPTSSALRVR